MVASSIPMNPKLFFRLLVAASLLFAIAGVLVAEFSGNVSEDWKTLAEWNGHGGIYDRLELCNLPTNMVGLIAVSALLIAFLLCILGVYLGLFFFWRWARVGNVAVTILFLALAPFSGLIILFPFEAGLYDLTMLCEGAVIALSYTAPIKEYFRPTSAT